MKTHHNLCLVTYVVSDQFLWLPFTKDLKFLSHTRDFTCILVGFIVTFIWVGWLVAMYNNFTRVKTEDCSTV